MNILYKLLYFYTFWAFVMHVLYFLKIIKNTFVIALFTLVGSVFLYHIYPNYYKKYNEYDKIKKYLIITDIIFHYLPVFIIPMDFSNINYFYMLTITYIILFNVTIFKTYKDPYKFMKKHNTGLIYC